MAAGDRNWSMRWNERAAQFFARYRIFPCPEFGSDAPAWGTKRIPRAYRRHQVLDAERWMITWYSAYVGAGGLNVSSLKIAPATKTLRLLGPRWLQYRYEDRGTKINTYKGLKQSLTNWVLDNERFAHASIEGLDMEAEFTSEACLGWIRSLQGKDSTILVHTLTLKTLFHECIALGWLDPDMTNPLERPMIQKAIGKLLENAKEKHVVTYLRPELLRGLLTAPTRKVTDYRRVRYLAALATGLRDHELQGLIWADLHLGGAIPYVDVQRQLDKVGSKPFRSADDLQRGGMKKDAILLIPNAIVSSPKRNSKRGIPLVPILAMALTWWRGSGWRHYVGRAAAKDDPVFPSGKSNRHNPPGQFAFVESPELLRKDLERVGQPSTFKDLDLDFHALRRTFSTLLNENGVSEAEVGDLLGHGAKSTARGHYLSPELLGRRLALLQRLPLPDHLHLQGKLIEVPRGERQAQVIRLPVDRLNR